MRHKEAGCLKPLRMFLHFQGDRRIILLEIVISQRMNILELCSPGSGLEADLPEVNNSTQRHEGLKF